MEGRSSFGREIVVVVIYSGQCASLLLDSLQQEKMTGQTGKPRALVGICHVHERYF